MQLLALTLMLTVTGPVDRQQRLVSINPCYDDWLVQWLEPSWQVIPSTSHGNRLEQIVALDPDQVVAGSFVGRQLRLALQERVKLTTMPYVSNWPDWRNAVLELGSELGQQQQAQGWLVSQEEALHELTLDGLGKTLVLMPNGFTWGQQSWVNQLLKWQNVQLSPLAGAGDLVRLSIEEVLQSQPDTVILEGFSTEYARAHDWLWHNGLQTWLRQRRVIEVDGAIASCSTIRSLDYLRQLNQALAKEPSYVAR